MTESAPFLYISCMALNALVATILSGSLFGVDPLFSPTSAPRENYRLGRPQKESH
jgi:hypothetical protein